MSLNDIRPTKNQLIITLVENAGVDVTDWANFSGGEARAASNPKYCYEWSFLQPGKLAVLNLWHEELVEKDGIIFQDVNLRNRAISYQGGDPRKRRALKMDETIRTAYSENLPIRVIVGAGRIRDANDPNAAASRMNKRLLDPSIWHINSYNQRTGDCLLVRGEGGQTFFDQFSILESSQPNVAKRITSGEVYVRSSEVRRRVLNRSRGFCELCLAPGFKAADGGIFLETHHVEPLFLGGPDTERNVVALCPNHHREAHHGDAREIIKQKLLVFLKNIDFTHPSPAKS